MKITDMSDEQIERYSAEKVLGAVLYAPTDVPSRYTGLYRMNVGGPLEDFCPLTDANDDVKVLDVVRKWNSYRLVEFSVLLGKLYSERNQTFAWEINFSMYEIGDYTRSAVAVMLAKKETGDE